MTSKTLPQTLVIYNLEVDEESPVLASAIDWISAFSEIFKEVKVYSTHVGKYSLTGNVKVIEIGGGTLKKRVFGVKVLLESVIYIALRRQNIVVFHHMSSKTAGTIGLLIALLKVPQGLWYSHSHPDRYLSASKYWVNYFFSSSRKSFPMDSRKAFFTGHGVPTRAFNKYDPRIIRSGVVSVGRIARIKNLEAGLSAIAASSIRDKSLHLYGESNIEDGYLRELQLIAHSSQVNLYFHGPFLYRKLPYELQKYSFIISSTPMSTDKALLEGAASGCFPITMNSDSECLTGISKIWQMLPEGTDLQMSKKLDVLDQLSIESQDELRRVISEHTSATSDVFVTARKIAELLTSASTR